MPKKVGIILINYKDYAARFLDACRDSLRAQDYPAQAVRIYIIDNASTPETLAYLSEHYPEAAVLPRPDGNYCAANNLGFRHAIADGCEYLVGLNMDTEAEPGWLSALVRALDENPAAGLAQAKILLYPRNAAEKALPKINSLGNIVHFLGFGFTSGYGEADREIAGYPEIAGYASGCSLIFRREAFEKAGAYDENYYMYHDDLEISLKLKLAGYKIILAPQAVVFHKYEFSRSTKMLYYMERNRFLAMLAFYPVRLLLLIALPAVIMELGMIVYSIIGGWFPTKLKADAYFLNPAVYPRIWRERKRIKGLGANRRSSLISSFAGRIEFQEIANPVLDHIANPILNFYWRLIKKII